MNRSLVPPTPVLPAVLLDQVRRLRTLLDELAPLLHLGLPPDLEALRGDTQIALERPESLECAENQLDFIEELVESVLSQPAVALTSAGGGGFSKGWAPLPGSGVVEAWEQLEQLSEDLCQEAEAWLRRRSVDAGDLLLADGLRSPV